jgi:hypothetical protein
VQEVAGLKPDAVFCNAATRYPIGVWRPLNLWGKPQVQILLPVYNPRLVQVANEGAQSEAVLDDL